MTTGSRADAQPSHTAPSLVVIRGETGDRPDGVGVGVHQHAMGELSWSSGGVQRMPTSAGVWVVPAKFAIWTAGNQLHDSVKFGCGVYHWIKVAPELAPALPPGCCAVRVSTVLERTMRELAGRGQIESGQPETAGLVSALTTEVRDSGLLPVALRPDPPAPLQAILARLYQEPADEHTVGDWAQLLGVSPRSLNRSFRKDMGASFREVRLRMRLISALEGLARGEDVGHVAHRVGYRSVSRFVEVFHRRMGATPGRYFDESY